MNRRSLIGFLFLNAVVTLLMTSAIIYLYNRQRPADPTRPPELFQVIITATPNPFETPRIEYIVVTATPPGASAGIVIQPTPGPGTPQPAVPTLDPSLLPPDIGPVASNPLTPTDPSGCPTYAIKQGDTLGRIAPAFGVTVEDLRRANNLTERDERRLQIGQVLIVPVNGCGLSTNTPVPTETPTREITDTPPPTSTPVVTVAAVPQAQIEITQVLNPGDITREGIEIRNISGGLVDIGGWRMRDRDGNEFVFPNYQMYENRRVVVYTRGGPNTALALFWGLPEAIWDDPAQEVVIVNGTGEEQARFRLADQPGEGVVLTATP